MMAYQNHLWPKRGEFKDTFNCEEKREKQVEVAEDVHVEKGGALKLEHEKQGVEDDEEEDELLKRCRGDQPPYVVSG